MLAASAAKVNVRTRSSPIEPPSGAKFLSAAYTVPARFTTTLVDWDDGPVEAFWCRLLLMAGGGP